MIKFNKVGLWLLVAALLLAACDGAGGLAERPIRTGNVIDRFNFEGSGGFETGSYTGAAISVRDGEYRIESEQGVMWGQSSSSLTDSVIEVQVRAETNNNDARYGVMCRADPRNNGNGYLFALSPDNRYFIMRGEADGYSHLKAGQLPRGLINEGMNTLRAVCLGTYLALYVNGTFVAAISDNVHIAGQVALAAGPAQTGLVTAYFDNLVVLEVAYEQPTAAPAQ